jgi:hypothetical protein
MSHGSITLQIMNLYASLLLEKFRIGKVSQFSQQVMLTIMWDPTGIAVVTAIGN